MRDGWIQQSQLVVFYYDEAPPLISIFCECVAYLVPFVTQIDEIYSICWHN